MMRVFSSPPGLRLSHLSNGLLAVTLTVAASLFAQEAPKATITPDDGSPSATLTLDEAVHLALAANFDVKIDRSSVDVARESTNIANTEFEPTFSATINTSKSQSPGGFNGTIPLPGTLFEQQRSRVSVSQKISTGAVLSLSGALDRNERNQTSSVYNSDATLAVSQPLLKGGGRNANLANVKRTRLDLLSAGKISLSSEIFFA